VTLTLVSKIPQSAKQAGAAHKAIKVILGFLYSFCAKVTNFGAISWLNLVYPAPPGK
jgi:hypothetical protein